MHDPAAHAADVPAGLQRLGLDPATAAQLAPHVAAGLVAGRVSRVDRGALTVLTDTGPLRAVWPRGELAPAVGDWVALRPDGPDGRHGVAHVAERRSAFLRHDPGAATAGQVVAANVDVALIVCSLAARLGVRRIERYLALAWQSGATPVIVLSKVDLCEDPLAAVAAVEAVAFGVPVHTASALTGDGIAVLRGYAGAGRTVALLGPSGVGKSTLINALVGADVLRTGEVRGDGKGRHTTTHRELVLLPGGGVLLDTPGMRGLLLWDAADGIEQVFVDVEELVSACRFADCSHEGEPGCAVREALRDGRLPPERYESWSKLQRELRALERRQDVRLRSEARREWRIRERGMRQRARLGE